MAFSCAKPSSHKVALTGRIRTMPKANAEGNTRLEMREAGKNHYVVNFLSGAPGLLSHRWFWLIFSPVIIRSPFRTGREAFTSSGSTLLDQPWSSLCGLVCIQVEG